MNQILDALISARLEGREARLEGDLPETLAEAYGIAIKMLPAVAAWKIGGANPWSRDVFGNTEVFFGPLAPEEIYHDKTSVPLTGLVAPLAEPELAVRLRDPDADSVEAAFDAVALSVEIPASVLPPEAKSLLVGQVLDRAGAGALWIGPVISTTAEVIAGPVRSEFRKNNALPVAGHSDNILPSPLGVAMEFLALARRYGLNPEKGQWIATGGLSPAVPVAPGDRLSLRALGTEASFRFI